MTESLQNKKVELPGFELDVNIDPATMTKQKLYELYGFLMTLGNHYVNHGWLRIVLDNRNSWEPEFLSEFLLSIDLPEKCDILLKDPHHRKSLNAVSSMEEYNNLSDNLDIVILFFSSNNSRDMINCLEDMRNGHKTINEIVTFKYSKSNTPTIEDLQPLFTYLESISVDFIMDKNGNCLTNNPNFPLKGLRTIDKYFLKYSYANAWLNVQCDSNLLVSRANFSGEFNQPKEPPISLNELQEKLMNFNSETLRLQRFQNVNCCPCQCQNKCFSGQDQNIQFVNNYFCLCARAAYIINDIVNKLPIVTKIPENYYYT